MSVILGSTGITFPDATTQTTAATAGGVTSIVAGTGISVSGTTAVTVNVVNTLGAVGTYAFLRHSAGSGLTPGSTLAASVLYYAGIYASGCCTAISTINTQPSAGTWKVMGGAVNAAPSSLFVRTV